MMRVDLARGCGSRAGSGGAGAAASTFDGAAVAPAGGSGCVCTITMEGSPPMSGDDGAPSANRAASADSTGGTNVSVVIADASMRRGGFILAEQYIRPLKIS